LTNLSGHNSGIDVIREPLFDYHSHLMANNEIFEHWQTAHVNIGYYCMIMLEDIEIKAIHFRRRYILFICDYKGETKYFYQWFSYVKQSDRFTVNGNPPNPEYHHFNDFILDMLDRGIDSNEEIVRRIMLHENDVKEIYGYINKLHEFSEIANRNKLLIPKKAEVNYKTSSIPNWKSRGSVTVLINIIMHPTQKLQ